MSEIDIGKINKYGIRSSEYSEEEGA